MKIFKNVDQTDKAFLTYDVIYILCFICFIMFNSFN